MPAIVIHALTKTYPLPNDNEIQALQGIDLQIDAGEIYALLGPNGAGKTTLLSILTTLLLPTTGQAEVAGFDVVAAPGQVRRRIGVTFQESVLDEQLTGRQSLQFHGRLYGMGRDEIAQAIGELGALVELTDALDRKASGYSGGMKRRLELIRGLLTKPAILFLDEPTQGLDPHNRAAIWQYLTTLRRELNLTILLTTHYMEEAEALADRVGIIDHGKLALEGEPRALSAGLGQDMIVVTGSGDADRLEAQLHACEWAGTITRYARDEDTAAHAPQDAHTLFQIGVTNGAARLAELVNLAAAAGFQIHELSINRPTLADVFLAATGSSLRDE